MSTFIDALIGVSERLRDDCEAIAWAAPVAYVYNPLVYAWAPYEAYLRRCARPQPEVVLIGMNPGPFGMLQTGVPFGDVGFVRDWLGISGEVGRPPREHPRRPVQGYAVTRGEVSGRRVWGWARSRFGTPERFFSRFFVHNYCPLGFFAEDGTNLTPDKFRGEMRAAIYAACDRALADTLALLRPELVMGIGRFAEQRVRAVVGEQYRVAAVAHPSPANPATNAAGWDRLADAALAAQGIVLPPPAADHE